MHRDCFAVSETFSRNLGQNRSLILLAKERGNQEQEKFFERGAKFLRKNVRCKVEEKALVRQNRDTPIHFVRWLYRRGK